MNFAAILHEPKSRMSYACDGENLQLRIKVAKGDADRISVRAVDPYSWFPTKEDPSKYVFATEKIREFPMVKECSTEYHDVWFANIGNFPFSRIRYGFVLESGENRYFFGSHYVANLLEKEEEQNNLWNYYNFPYLNLEDIYHAPKWVEDTVWYQIFPYSFSCDGEACDPSHPGTLGGVIKKLDYIQKMGFNGIYFTPVFSSPSEHKYDTRDYYSIDSWFGTNEIFETLVTEAHKRGIRIMLDAVFNHCGAEHPFWQDVLKNGKDSKYYDCFYILDPSKRPEEKVVLDGIESVNYRTFALVPDMPKWNTDHPLVLEHLLGAAAYWVEKYHIDGWRLDVSNEVSHDFWREFRKCVKKINPELYILGENWDNSIPWLGGDQMDAVMNYEFMNPVWNFFGTQAVGKGRKQSFNAEQFQNAVSALLTDYPKPITKVMFNLLESHDTNRLMTVCENNPELAKLAYVVQMTFPGSPSVYYGGEIGLDGPEGENRKPMDWKLAEKGCSLQEHIRRLIEIRKQNSCCKSLDLFWLLADNEKDVIIYNKKYGSDSLYVLIHNGSSDETISLPEVLQNKSCFDVYTDKKVQLETSLSLKPYSFLLLKEADQS